jgi:hypothetical protein
MAYVLRAPSSAVLLQANVVTGPTSTQSNLLLTARAGNNGQGGNAEVSLKALGGSTVSASATWDPIFGGSSMSRFNSFFQLRLDVDAAGGVCHGSAGTLPWLEVNAEPFTLIERVQLSASVRKTGAQREASWESGYVQFRYQGGYTEELILDALPRALTPQKFRISAQEPAEESLLPLIEQYAEMTGENVVGFTVVGLIKFTANEAPATKEVLGADDLSVSVAVFTNAEAQAQPLTSLTRHQHSQRRHRP